MNELEKLTLKHIEEICRDCFEKLSMLPKNEKIDWLNEIFPIASKISDIKHLSEALRNNE